MNKRFLIVAGSVLLAGIGVAVHLSNWDSAPRRWDASDQEYAAQAVKLGRTNAPVQATPAPLDLSKPVRLAIGGLGLADNAQNERLGDLVTADMSGAPGFQLVERPALKAILAELNLSWSGFVRAKDAVRVGKMIPADWFLLGTRTTINGTNSLVVRVVDAHTGILHDADVFAGDPPALELAADLARFLQQSRQNAARAQTREYLAIGAFEDVSLNNRQADFPSQLHGYLTAAYRGGKVTLLEREQVETLQQEVRLDLAGLTEENGTNPPPPMQSAFWLVSGQYQSYETTNLQVELKLEVRRMFGRAKHLTVHGLAGEPVDRQIKTAIEEVINQSGENVIPNRLSEARAQMGIGEDLHPVDKGFGDMNFIFIPAYWDMDPQFAARQKRNVEEAMRAFETVLLLEPTNHEAKMYLAACLRDTTIYRLEEARNDYREIIEDSGQDKWTEVAKKALVETFRDDTSDETARWFETAGQQVADGPAAEFYRQHAKAAAADMAANINRGYSPEARQGAEARLLDSIQSCRKATLGENGTFTPYMGMRDYVQTMGFEPATAAQKLAELLPKMTQSAPEMAPYLQATVVTFQVDTNAPVVAEFTRTLQDGIDHPDHVFQVKQFWQLIRGDIYDWCYKKDDQVLSIILLEGEQRAAAGGYVDFNSQEKIKLAYAYEMTKRWREALDLFDGFAGQPVHTEDFGPWGQPFRWIYPDKMAAFCRRQLGLPDLRSPLEFDLGAPVMCLCSPSTFTTEESGLWVGIGGQLLHLDYDLKTNLVINLPMDAGTPITALCVTASKVWIGTAGDGLIEYDKAGRRCRRLTETDGLMMNSLTSLQAAGDSLWIGYGGATGGGLGLLDLSTQKLKSFMPSMLAGNGPASGGIQPPREPIDTLVTRANGDVWMHLGPGLRQFDGVRNVWGSLPQGEGDWISCFTADADKLAEGMRIFQDEIVVEKPSNQMGTANQTVRTTLILTPQEYFRLDANVKTNGSHERIISVNSSNIHPIGGVSVQSLRDQHWLNLVDAKALPNPPSTMLLDGKYLWVGGESFFTLVDLTSGKVRKFCHILSDGVDRIQIGGGYVWAQFDWHLYRAPLSALE